MEPHFESGIERGKGESPKREMGGSGKKEFNGIFYGGENSNAFVGNASKCLRWLGRNFGVVECKANEFLGHT